MKKLFTLLTLALLSIGSAWALTGTDKASNTGTKNTDISGTSYTLPGTYIAGAGGATATGMANKGVKLRTGSDGARVVFNVNEKYTFTSFKLYAVSNYALKDGASEPCISVTKVEVDGEEVEFDGTGNFPAKGSSTAGSILLEGISATQTVAIYFDNSNAGGTQINAYYEIGWSKPDASVPEATTVSPSYVGMAVGQTTTLTGTFTGGSFTGEWISDNEAVATVTEAGVVTAKATGTAHITYQWTEDNSQDAYKATAEVVVVKPFNAEACDAVKTYDFKNWGATTLTIQSEAAGNIWNEANKKTNAVFFCTNTGLENIAVQAVLSSKKGWAITDAGLYEGSEAGRCAAVAGIKAGQFVEFIHTSGTSFYTKSDGSDDGIKKVPVVTESGRHIFYALEDGMIGFELTKGKAVEKIVIYEESSLVATTLTFSAEEATANIGEAFTAPTLTTDPEGLSVTYASSDTDVAEVDANSGAVTVKAVGTTVITASFAGDETYRPSSASYTLTVVDPNAKTVTATFAFESGAAGQVAVVSADDVFSITGVEVADMTYAGIGSDQGITGTKMQPSSSASDNKSQYVKFTVTPKKGITFVPKKVSFDALRWGTDGSNKLHYYAEAGTASQELGNVNPNRNGKGEGWSHYEHEITTDMTSTKDEPFSLACYVYGLATSKQISFANIVIEGEYSGEAVDETMYAITTSVTPEGAGNVIQSPAGASLPEGSEVEFSAAANTGYKFLNKWTVNGTEIEGETYSVASLSENLDVVAQFQKLFAVSFAVGEGDKGTSNPLTTQYTEGAFTIPAENFYISKNGYTTTGWTDGENTYDFGQEINLTGDITLTPVFAENTVALNETKADVKVDYNFNTKTGGATINIENSTGYYIKQVTVNGEQLDVPLFIDNLDNHGIDGKRGKTNNVGRENAQINTGAKFTIPAVSGMTVEIKKSNGSWDGTTIAGDDYDGTYTYTGTDESIDIIFTSDGLYITNVVVTYPAVSQAVTVGTAGWATTVTTKALDFTGASVKAYTAKLSDNTVTLTEATQVPAGTALILKAAAGSYDIPVIAEADDVDNDLKGSATEATVMDDANTYYGLAINGNGSAQFTKIEAGGTIAAGKAYLMVAGVAGAKVLAVSFGEATGISSLSQNADKENAQFYNLAGQRVAQPQKGLYIVNGKKVVK